MDITFIRENKDIVQFAANKKRRAFVVDNLIMVDDKRRELVASIEELKKGGDEQAEALAKMMEGFRAVMKEWQTLMVAVPNIPDMSVPEGASRAENREEAVVGTVPNFSFKPKPANELVPNLPADLSFALVKAVLDKAVVQGFEVRLGSSLVNRQSLIGAGYIPDDEKACVKVGGDNYLPISAHVSAFAEYADRVFEEADLPKKDRGGFSCVPKIKRRRCYPHVACCRICNLCSRKPHDERYTA